MAKREKKRARGIALRPPLWERVEYWAEQQDKSTNEFMEAVLDLHVPRLPDSRKSEADIREPEAVVIQ